MAQRVTTSFINTNRPGSYFETNVKSTPVGVASSGNIVIFGEADGGAASAAIDTANGDVLKDNFYGPDQLAEVERKYIRGPIVDAFRALSSPSSDGDIQGSANRIYIVKTNQSSKAQIALASNYGTLLDKNWGKDGNKYAYQITQSLDEEGPQHTGTAIGAYGAALDGATFTLRQNGGAEVIITLSNTATDHQDRPTLLVELNSLLPAGLEAVAGTAAETIVIQAEVDATANGKGWGKSFELIDANPGDLALLGLSEGLYFSSQEPEVQLDITRQDNNTNESFLVEAEVALLIGYEGTTATVSITDNQLTTTVTGGSGANLSVNLADYATLQDLADYIDSQTGYSATAQADSAQLSPVALDDVTTQGIASTGAGLEAGRIKVAAYRWSEAVSTSVVLDFEAGSAHIGLPATTASKTFLAGGDKGGTLAANIVKAIDDAETIDVNFLIPLFSRDATADIADSLTESSSTYTISAINALVKNHVLKMSTAKIKRHRTAFCSIWDSYSAIKTQAGSLAHFRVSLAMQRASQTNSVGQTVNYLPWYSACIAAGMQAAGFYRNITNKLANVISFQDPTGFDSGSVTQIEDALDSGLLFMEKRIDGSAWVADQTTYKTDTNFVYNSIQAVYAMDLVSLDLAASFQRAFVGQSLADVDATTGLSFLASKMNQYKSQKLISASEDAPLAYKNAKVRISGPIMEVAVEIKLTTAIYFVPISIEISQVQSAA